MSKYDPKFIEEKWQKYWDKHKTYSAHEDDTKEKFYGLVEFPYPSGAGLHVGHPRSYTAMDVICRKRRMQGYSVMYPIGFDAFGLPTENFAIKTGRPPVEVTKENIATFTRQLKSLGFSFDWDRAVDTTDPAYYKWTQWIFSQLFKHGLAYKENKPINWCISCKIGLANEEVVDGKCERCGGSVEKRDKEQWMLAITKYADELIEGLEKVDYIPQAKTQQKNWIGRSEGAEVDFFIPKYKEVLFATSNHGKRDRMQALLKNSGIDCTLHMPSELGLEEIEVEEDDNLAKNAEKKARAYKGQVDMPILAGDSGLFADNIDIDPAKVKRNALGDKSEHELSQQKIYEKMIEYYKDIAKKHGGSFDAAFINHFVLLTPDGALKRVKIRREIEVTDTIKEPVDIYLPIRAIYKSKSTGKYPTDQTKSEKLIEMAPDLNGVKELLGHKLKVFTTRPDTLFGATYCVLSPEHELVDAMQGTIQNWDEVHAYMHEATLKSDLERSELQKEKTGVELKGIKAINPVNGEAVSVWVADYVLTSYGTGAIMAVPAHDERDFEFATKYSIEILKVIEGGETAEVYSGDGKHINSNFIDGLNNNDANTTITKWLEDRQLGEKTIQFKLRDWVFSRQRYWGEPIPLVYCTNCAEKNDPQSEGEKLNPGWIPLDDTSLPLELPHVEKYEPTDTGESPLAAIRDWVETKCPRCGGAAQRETDTMPNWAGSSWYFLRYMDPNNNEAFASKENLKYWGQVDWYNGGMEHTVLHLLYSRFWNQFLFNIKEIPHKEAYAKRTSHGMILAEGGEKMSKSKGNVVNPDEMVDEYGADALRGYIMFMGPFDQAVEWNTKGLVGVRRFIDKFWALQDKLSDSSSEEVLRAVHQAVEKVGSDIEKMHFNTSIAKLMETVNVCTKADTIGKNEYEMLVKILSPFMPHISEELWSQLGHDESIVYVAWPEYDESLLVSDMLTIAVQVNGKVRTTIEINREASEDEVTKLALEQDAVQKWLDGNEPKKVIYVKGRLVSIVV